MNLSDCFKAICLHYGKLDQFEGKPVRTPREYDPYMGKEVADWMRAYGKTHQDFQPLFDELKKRYSVSYRTLPDAAKLQTAAEAVENAVPVVERDTPPPPTDAERETVVAGLGEIMMNLKYGKRVERSEPYSD